MAVSTPAQVACYLEHRVFHPWEEIDQEEAWVLLRTIKNQVTHRVLVYRGAITGTNVRGAEIFKEAVRVNAPTIIVAHCHPSGNPEPSVPDVLLTCQLKEAARLLDIALLDHVSFAGERYASMRGTWAKPRRIPGPPQVWRLGRPGSGRLTS